MSNSLSVKLVSPFPYFYCKYEYIYRCIPPRVCIPPLQPLHLSSPSLLSSSSPLYQVPRHHCTATLKRGKERKTFSCNNNLLREACQASIHVEMGGVRKVIGQRVVLTSSYEDIGLFLQTPAHRYK